MVSDAFLVSAVRSEGELDETIEIFGDTMAAVRAGGLI